MDARLKALVLTEGNTSAFSAVADCSALDGQRKNMFIYGPKQSGKSTLFQVCAGSPKVADQRGFLYVHAGELIAQAELGENINFLENCIKVQLMFIDELEYFIQGPDFGKELLSSLLQARFDKKLYTIVASNITYEDVDFDSLGVFAKSYERYEIAPLEKSNYKELAQKTAHIISPDPQNAPILTDDTFDYLANDFAQNLSDIKNSVTYLMTAADFPAGTLIDAQTAAHALGK